MKVIILVGPPGSGKSTFSSKYSNYVRISQDELGDRYKCLELFRKSLKDGKNVIVDRCNINKMQRRLWVGLAKELKVKEINCVQLVVNPELCIKRINERKGHPTIKENNLEKNKEIVYSFIKTLEIPEIGEGFNKILIMKNED